MERGSKRYNRSNDRVPPTNLYDALNAVFPGRSDIIDQITSRLGPLKKSYRPLHLDGCRSTKTGFLAYARYSQKTTPGNESWSPQYSSLAFQRDLYDEAHGPHITFLRGLLVGFIDADSRGSVKISGSCWHAPGHLIIAPPPNSRLRHAAVWIRDWRYIPSAKGGGLFEVLARDIIELSQVAPEPAVFRNITHDFECSMLPQDVRGFVRAKSCIISSKATSNFFVELSNSPSGLDSRAVVVIFQGRKAVKWWPFLSVGQDIGISGLVTVKLHGYNERVILRCETPEVVFFAFPRLHCGGSSSRKPDQGFKHQNQPKKARIDERDRENESSLMQGQHSLCTYEGEITNIRGEGKLELDHKVSLYLGSFTDRCAGPNVAYFSFRKGTRIVASWVTSIIREGSIRLFPTGRSSVDIIYFGELDVDVGLPRSHNNEWRWIWKRWHFRDIIWADDIHDALRKNFGNWMQKEEGCTPVDQSTESELSKYLLGTSNAVGLVQYAMFLSSGRKDLLNPNLSASRDLYREFLFPNQELDAHSFRPAILSLISIRETANYLWRKRHQEPSSPAKKSGASTGAPYQSTAMFSPSQIYEAFCERDSDRFKTGANSQGIAIAGFLQGSLDGYPCTILSDTTASVQTRIIGEIPLPLLGSLILVRHFSVIIEITSIESSGEVTLVFLGSAIEELLGGASKHQLQTLSSQGQRLFDILSSSCRENDDSDHTQRLISIPPVSKTQEEKTSTSKVSKCPLICIFVNELKPHTGNYVIAGALLAFSRNLRMNKWIRLSSPNEEFYRCSLTLSGQAMLKFAVAFRIGSLIAVSCTDLLSQSGPDEYLREKLCQSMRRQSPVKLRTCLEFEVPYVRSLGKGNKMKFYSKKEDPWVNCFLRGGFESRKKGKPGGTPSAQATVETLVQKIVSITSVPLWSALSRSSNENGIALRGKVRHYRPSFEDNAGVENIWQLCIQDEKIDVICITVDFYDKQYAPHGITEGMLVIVHNVSRVALQSGSRNRFVGNSGTFVDVISTESVGQNIGCFDCIRPPAISLLCSFLDFVTLAEFSYRNECEGKQASGAGIVRLRVLEVDRIHVRVLRPTNCQNCRSANIQNGDSISTSVSVVATVEDGSGIGTLICKGWGIVSKLLRLNQQEILALKAQASRSEGLNLTLEEAKAHQHRTDLRNCQNSSLTDVCETMCRERNERLFVLVLNKSRSCRPEESDLYQDSEILMKGFRLGFGRMLWTSISSTISTIVECSAVYDCFPAASGSASLSIEAKTIARQLLEKIF